MVVDAIRIPVNVKYDRAEQRMAECINFLESLGGEVREKMMVSFQNCLDHLSRIAENCGGEAILYHDFAPLSFGFGFTKWSLNGGMIFHGKHDGFGSGSAPTFSVCLNPTDGWSLHS
jgi:hypothetical protein